MRIVEREFVREVDVAAAVTLWNYMDLEHLTVVHKNYTDSQVLYEEGNQLIWLLTYRLPVFSFLQSHSLSSVVQTDEQTLVNYNIGLLGIPSITTIRVVEPEKDKSRITINYKFILSGWRQILAPLIYRMMATWNE